jgi:AcrR family transcriptional regulator
MKSVVAQRKKRAVERTREDILNAAVSAFVRAGFQSVTMRDIAREAGYTAAALYTYFENKQEIVGALLKIVLDEFLAVFDEPPSPALRFPQRLERILRRVCEQAERRRDLFLLFLSMAQANQHPQLGKEQPDPVRLHQDMDARLTHWLTENATSRDLGGHAAKDVARFLSGLMHSFMGDWVFQGTPPGELSGRTSLMVDLFFNGVGGGKRKQKSGAGA